MNCTECQAAESDAMSPQYRAGCMSCDARAIASSLRYSAAAVAGRLTPDYVEKLLAVFGTSVQAREDGHQMAKAWARRLGNVEAA